jgi:chromosome segregation ATPase
MKKTLLLFVVLGLVALMLVGCSSAGRLGDLEKRASDQTAQVAALKGQVDAFPAMLQANSSRVSDLEKDASTYAAMIASNGTLIAELQKRVEGYTSANERALVGLSDLEREVGGYSSQIENLGSDVDALRRQQDSQSVLLATNTMLITSRGEQVGELERKVERYLALGEAATGEVAVLKEKLAAQGATVDAAQADVARLEGEVQSWSERVAAGEEAVAALREEVAQLAARGASLRVGTVDLAEAAGAFREGVSEGVEAVTAKEAEIAALETAFAAGSLASESYQTQSWKLRSDLLLARSSLEAEALARLVASQAAAALGLEAALGSLEQVAQEVAKAALDLAADTTLDDAAFLARYETLSAAIEEIERDLRSTVAPLVREVVVQVAQEAGCDLVLERREILAGDAERLLDLTDLVKEALRARP